MSCMECVYTIFNMDICAEITGLLTFNESGPNLTLCFRENQGWKWTSRENRTTCALWSICIPEAAHEAGERENGIFWTCQGNLGIL